MPRRIAYLCGMTYLDYDQPWPKISYNWFRLYDCVTHSNVIQVDFL